MIDRSPHERREDPDRDVQDRDTHGHAETRPAEVGREGLEEDAVRVEDEPDGDEVRQKYDRNDAPAIEHAGRKLRVASTACL